jgi:hypothetical protein
MSAAILSMAAESFAVAYPILAESASLAVKSIADTKNPMDAPMTAPIINVSIVCSPPEARADVRKDGNDQGH